MKKTAVILLSLLLLLCSCGTNTGDGGLIDGDPSGIIDAVYEKLPKDSKAAGMVPGLITTVIDGQNEEYYLGVSGIKYKKGAASESFDQPVTYSFCIVIFEDGADYDAERLKIEKNINKSKWVCASAEEAFVVRYKNAAAVIMGSKDVCAELEKAFLSVILDFGK